MTSHNDYYEVAFEYGDFAVCSSLRTTAVLWIYLAHRPCGAEGVILDRYGDEGGNCNKCGWVPPGITRKPESASMSFPWDTEEFDNVGASQFLSKWLDIPAWQIGVGRNE